MDSAVLDSHPACSADMAIFPNRLELLRSGMLPKGAVVAEIGVNEGGFAKLIAEHSQPRELHLVDVFLGIGAAGARSLTDSVGIDLLQKVSRLFAPGIKDGRVVLHQGLSVKVLSAFPDGYFDWVYVDGDHSYEGVLADLLAAESKIKQGGLIAGHDIVMPGNEDKVLHHFPGVRQAVEQFCREHAWAMVAITEVGPNEDPDHDGRHLPSYVLARQ